MIYAQIDAAGWCFAVSRLAGVVDSPNLVPMAVFDESVLGKRWDGAAWQTV